MEKVARSVLNQSINKTPRLNVHVEGVGDILLERSSRAKHICLSIRPFKGVRIAVPHNVAYEEAMAVVHEKMPWILKQLKSIRHIEQSAPAIERPAIVNRVVARNVIVDRLATLADQHGFIYNKAFVRNQKTRWGSCSMQNNINLNVHLVRLPVRLMDYVILHELVHTRIKHHGTAFWEALEEVMPNAKERDRELNKYEVMLAY